MKRISFLNKKSVLAGLLILLLALAGYWIYTNNRESAHIDDTGSADYINYDPPTEEEIRAGETQTQEAARDQTTPPEADENGLKQVTPYITSADKDGVNAYIPKILEEGGICTATATNTVTLETVTANSKGFINVSYTSCEPIEFSLTSGEWSVVVSYKSSESEGQSEAEVIKVD